MNRRPRLPGADELFRATGGGASRAALAEVAATEVEEPSPRRGAAQRQAPAASASVAVEAASDDEWDANEAAPARPVRIARRKADNGPTGRERHDEKITVYCSPDELLQIEQARLTLRASHRLAVDRGRIVREAVAVVLADLEAKGESSILVRRLRGR